MDFGPIIKEQRKELEDIYRNGKIVKRELHDKAEQFLKHPNILAVLGIRRAGKSIFSYLLAKEKSFGYINFDDERLTEVKTENLNDILQSFYELYGDIDYVVLDEIQNVEKWELFANRLRRTKKVIITGSNSKLLSGELATHITGRYIDVVLFPFSFREFLDFKQFRQSKVYTTQEQAVIINLLREYFENGGFPEAYKFGRQIVTRIYEDIITKDVILRHKIKKVIELKKLSKYLVTNFGNEISYSRLPAFTDIKHISTISNWVSYLENSFLIIKLERFSFKLKQQFIAPKKVYCIDTGIIQELAFKFSENIGRFMENTVAVELHRRKSLSSNLEIYYWKDYQQHEIDFVIKDDIKIKQLIQVSYITEKNEIKEREIKALLKASKELRCNALTCITWSYNAELKIEGKRISFVPLWKWLLE